uniref:WAP domain-containing protein n=1 Tax=Strongyloides papillosus TaxID=174720 RepID=A0A0N5BXC3_STREA
MIVPETLCDFFKKAKLDFPECREKMLTPVKKTFKRRKYSKITSSTIKKNSVMEDYLKKELPLCPSTFHSCMNSIECESGTMCYSPFGQCCTNPLKNCPNPTAHGISCRTQSPINWCNKDNDCMSSRAIIQKNYICCPTGCNYNVCLEDKSSKTYLITEESNVPQSIISIKVFPDDCPDTKLINVQCRTFNPTSWCEEQYHCPTISINMPRRCCPTPCGYNTCVLKVNDKWVIA